MGYRLKAEVRERKSPRALRRQGRVPGVVYGHDIHELISFDRRELEGLLAKITRSSRISLELNGKEYDTFIKEIQYDPLTDRVIHVDLYRPPADRPVTMEVPIRLYGEAKGRRGGGIVDPLRETVEVRGPSAKIPELIEVDITELDIGQALHAGDVPLPEGVELLTPPEAVLVTVLAPRKVVEEVLEEAAAEAAEEAAPAAEGKKEEAEEAE